ncbi:MAG: single-stranded-DNA-specific exonuclease RecJ [Clostridia bacterium]|nr:single-stranded-DNA-specific exonuclease RecJ [Clostridia bacterium]
MLRFSLRGQAESEPIEGFDPLMSRLMRSRGIRSAEEARAFLSPSLDQLHDPFAMPGMDRAVRLIRRAAEKGDPVIVYGDYDCDGVCASAILTETLRELGAKADFRLPDRHRDGYGLSEGPLRRLAGEGCRLLITVDCGISNHREVDIARHELGMTVIVTDHHQIGPDGPPKANAVLNPLIAPYPFPRLCGAGVALKLTQALLGMDAVKKRLDLAALATVADLVPLTGENRAIVAAGLPLIRDTVRPGLRCLLDNARVEGEVTSSHLAYRLGPRINAGGRLGDASRCVRLLLTRDGIEAAQIASELEQTNTRRQALQLEITKRAEEMMTSGPDPIRFSRDRAIVVMGEGWESGVVGLAAGKLCEKYHWPTVVLSRKPENGQATGSCRSIPGISIFEVLCACRDASPDLFLRFGGHEQAAGFTIRAERLPELRRRINEAIDGLLGGDRSCYIPVALYDGILPAEDVSLELIGELERFEPTGYGNPAPAFLSPDTQVEEARPVGGDGSHLKLRLSGQGGMKRIDGIAFGKGSLCARLGSRADLLFSPEKNEFNGRIRAQLMVQEIRPSVGSEAFPEENLLREQLLQEITVLAENDIRIPGGAEPLPLITEEEARRKLAGGLGVLAVAHDRSTAAALSAVTPPPDILRAGEVPEPQGFAAVALHCDPQALSDSYAEILLADGDLLPGEADALRARCPGARLYRLPENRALAAEIASWLPDLALLRKAYAAAARGQASTPEALARATGCDAPMRLRAAMTALRECGYVAFTPAPWQCRYIGKAGTHPEQAPIVRALEAIRSGS